MIEEFIEINPTQMKPSNIMIGALVILIFAFFGYQLYHRPVKTVNNVAELVKLESSKPRIEVDKEGKTHVIKEIVYVTDDQASLLYRAQIDTLTRSLKLKDKQIAGMITIAGKADVDIKPVIDTASKTVAYNSKWLSFSGNLSDNLFKVSIRDSLTLAFVKHRYGLFHLKERIEINAFSNNPAMRYYSINSWMIPETRNNKSSIGLGVTLGYGIQLSNNTVTYGPQATAGLQIRF